MGFRLTQIAFFLYIQASLYTFEYTSTEDEYPDVGFLFETEDKTITIPPFLYKDLVIKNVSIDLEKLDLKKFKSQLNIMKSKIKESSDERDIENVTELVPSRRQKELLWDHELNNYPYFWPAAQYMVMQKTFDLMLQYIYMAKHKLKSLQSNKYFRTTDTGYRIGYGYKKLSRMYIRMRDIYLTMEANRDNFRRIDMYLQLHLKATKIHVDFLYLWWIIIRVDAKYKARLRGPNTIPEWMYYPYTSG